MRNISRKLVTGKLGSNGPPPKPTISCLLCCGYGDVLCTGRREEPLREGGAGRSVLVKLFIMLRERGSGLGVGVRTDQARTRRRVVASLTMASIRLLHLVLAGGDETVYDPVPRRHDLPSRRVGVAPSQLNR